MFNIGDRVRITAILSNYPEARIGMVGTVRVLTYHGDVGVEWDNVTWGHNLDGRLNNRKGYYVKPDMLRLGMPVRPGSVEAYIQRELSHG